MGHQVIAADLLDGEGIHAMHVGQDLEGAFFRTEQPVYWLLFISLAVVGPELLHQIGFQIFVETFLEEVQVLSQGGFSPDYFEEVLHALQGIVGKGAGRTHDGDDGILIDHT